MIQIKFKSEPKARQKYLTLIADECANKLSLLKTSLTHLNAGPDTTDPGFASYEAVTKKIINSLQKKKERFADDKFKSMAAYQQTVSDYFATEKTKLKSINIPGLIALIDHLTANKHIELNKLLISPADKLAGLNDHLITTFKIGGILEIKAIGLGFDWTVHSEISGKIKEFFQDEKMVIFCPYCNINEADYSEENGTDVIGSHFYLDHFFDKAKSPLLTFSMFNLVTCDSICNGPNNKGTTKFTDDFHLNPYIAGMDRSRMIFKPQIKKVGADPIYIEPYVLPPQTANTYQQLIGNYPQAGQCRDHGNINVFRLDIKYNRDHVYKRAGSAQRKLEDHFQSRDRLDKFLVRMKKKIDAKLYSAWYYEEFHTEFLPENFHRAAYSKLVRDIHDNLLELDTSNDNAEIKKIVTAHPA